MKQNINTIYSNLLAEILDNGDKVTTRNAETFSHITLPRITFTETPLVSIRKTAWKKAIREMEWFMSGENKCPEELLDWWEGQLDENKRLINGYSKQFRAFSNDLSYQSIYVEYFDQIKFILNGLHNNPNSRRLLLTVWNPGEMADIANVNNNPNTPTCCHSIIVQFFVRENKLWMTSYQRSADMLLGVPHNWIQSWAMLLYFAYHSGFEVGGMTWDFGDAHIYNEVSHLKTAIEIIEAEDLIQNIELIYSPKEIDFDESGVPIFKTSDFYIEGTIPNPTVTKRPRLL